MSPLMLEIVSSKSWGPTDRKQFLACKSNSVYNKINDIYVFYHAILHLVISHKW